MQYQIEINDRNYSSWEMKPTNANFKKKNPFEKKLFNEDTFEIREEENQTKELDEIHIVKSPTRQANYLAGVLILEKNKTFGRTPNKKRLYYSCIPHDKHLPTFLVPYDIDIGFEKVFPNKYVLFRFDHWTTLEKHPYGILVETIGDVTNLFYHDIYQLYAKNLHHPHKLLQKRIQHHIKTKGIDTCIQEILSDPKRFGKIEDRREIDRNIFSIDPHGCMDRDDALSICTIIPNHKYQVSVYIANVAIWIEFFQIYTFLQDTNISTIYLQDTVIPMLPTALSEKICSLDQTHDCFAIVMDFEIDLLAKTIQTINTKQCVIRVKRNFDYTTKGLSLYPPYANLLRITQTFHSEITESHALVAFWMMQMNQEMAKELYQNKTGIFRVSTSNPIMNNKKDPTQDIFLYIWENAISGKYIAYSKDINIVDYTHAVIDVPVYTHFTSPIRRIVDIYNQITWVNLQNKTPVLKINIDIDLDKINRDTKTIRKIQQESKILYLLQETASSLPIQGQILQIEDKHTLVYFPIYKCIFSCKTIPLSEWELYQEVACKIFMFEREIDYRKKIKIELC